VGYVWDSAWPAERRLRRHRRSKPVSSSQRSSSVKPSAQPTLVRTQHLPPVTTRSISRSARQLAILSPPAPPGRAGGLQTARSSRASVRAPGSHSPPPFLANRCCDRFGRADLREDPTRPVSAVCSSRRHRSSRSTAARSASRLITDISRKGSGQSKRSGTPLAIADGDAIRPLGCDGEPRLLALRHPRVCQPGRRAPTRVVPSEPVRACRERVSLHLLKHASVIRRYAEHDLDGQAARPVRDGPSSPTTTLRRYPTMIQPVLARQRHLATSPRIRTEKHSHGARTSCRFGDVDGCVFSMDSCTQIVRLCAPGWPRLRSRLHRQIRAVVLAVRGGRLAVPRDWGCRGSHPRQAWC